MLIRWVAGKMGSSAQYTMLKEHRIVLAKLDVETTLGRGATVHRGRSVVDQLEQDLLRVLQPLRDVGRGLGKALQRERDALPCRGGAAALRNGRESGAPGTSGRLAIMLACGRVRGCTRKPGGWVVSQIGSNAHPPTPIQKHFWEFVPSDVAWRW